MFIQFTSDYSVQTTGISIKYVSSDRTVSGRVSWEIPPPLDLPMDLYQHKPLHEILILIEYAQCPIKYIIKPRHVITNNVAF